MRPITLDNIDNIVADLKTLFGIELFSIENDWLDQLLELALFGLDAEDTIESLKKTVQAMQNDLNTIERITRRIY